MMDENVVNSILYLLISGDYLYAYNFRLLANEMDDNVANSIPVRL